MYWFAFFLPLSKLFGLLKIQMKAAYQHNSPCRMVGALLGSTRCYFMLINEFAVALQSEGAWGYPELQWVKCFFPLSCKLLPFLGYQSNSATGYVKSMFWELKEWFQLQLIDSNTFKAKWHISGPVQLHSTLLTFVLLMYWQILHTVCVTNVAKPQETQQLN